MIQLRPNPCFASDNCAGICPEAFEAMAKANTGFEPSYGGDYWTKEANALFQDVFETECETFFVFNGTAGNSLSLAALCEPHHGIICHEYAHIETDECGAPEFFNHGAKLLLGTGDNGKVTPAIVEGLATKRSDVHFHKPRALSITQATEFGTVYSIAEIRALVKAAKSHELVTQMDGARFANAVVSLDVHPREMTVDCGIDVLVFGGSKNGMAFGEAVVFFNMELAAEFAYRRKQSGQLASKARFIAAPWVGMLKDNVWLKHARHANRCAEILEKKLGEIPEVKIVQPRQVNTCFIKIAPGISERVKQKGWLFFAMAGSGGERLMCNWNTTEELIEEFVGDLKESVKSPKA